jgi:hypothetical protein
VGDIFSVYNGKVLKRRDAREAGGMGEGGYQLLISCDVPVLSFYKVKSLNSFPLVGGGLEWGWLN